MKIRQVLLIALLSAATFGFAQTEQSEKTYKNDIGFNTVFILNGVFNSSQTPFSLMYKKYTSEKKALRIGTSINVDWNNPDISSGYSNTTSYYTSYANVSIMLGKEFQNSISSKWVWYYGADLVPSFTLTKSSVYYGVAKNQESDAKMYGLSVRPFLGIRFAINHRLYLSAEANLSAGYKRFVENQKYFNPDATDGHRSGDNIFFTMNPASGLFLYYRF